MNSKIWLRLICLLGLAFAPAVSLAAAIHLKPGQCIMVGSQEVCAMHWDQSQPGVTPKPDHTLTTFVCKWGAPADAGDGTKGYGLYRVHVKESGEKIETLLQSFGPLPSDKSECGALAEKNQK